MGFFRKLKTRRLEKELYKTSLEILRRVDEDYESGLIEQEVAEKWHKSVPDFRKWMVDTRWIVTMEETRRCLKLRDKGYSLEKISKKMDRSISFIETLIEVYGDFVLALDNDDPTKMKKVCEKYRTEEKDV